RLWTHELFLFALGSVAAPARAPRRISPNLPVKPVPLSLPLPLFHLLSRVNAAAHKREMHSPGLTRLPTPSSASRTIRWATWLRRKQESIRLLRRRIA